MTLADEIIYGKKPNFEAHLAQGETLDDIDEYGFTPLIECAIVDRLDVAKTLIANGVDIEKPDVTGRTALHWAVDNENLALTKLLLAHGANPNAYNRGGQSVLVFPLLRDQWVLKQVLYQAGACLDFSLDFINTKLIGHRFELKGDVDIVSPQGEFIELDYEGFFLEFSLSSIADSLSRFRNHYSAREIRAYFGQICEIIDGYSVASKLMQLQHQRLPAFDLEKALEPLIAQHILILPIAYRGHAIAFIKCGEFWAKIDRGENSLKEGTVNIYKIHHLQKLTPTFYRQLLFQKQTKSYVHEQINQQLGLEPILQVPISAQIAGNCSWANIEAVVPTSFIVNQLALAATPKEVDIVMEASLALSIYQRWLTWDKDRALDECIQSMADAGVTRRVSKAAILGSVLFQACDYGIDAHMRRAEKILKILIEPDIRYILDSYLDIYCLKRLTKRGNNLLKLLEDNGIDPKIGINPVATPTEEKDLPS